MILSCQNTFRGKKLKFWSLVRVILTLEGVFRGNLTTGTRKRAFQSSPEFSHPPKKIFSPILDEIGQNSNMTLTIFITLIILEYDKFLKYFVFF